MAKSKKSGSSKLFFQTMWRLMLWGIAVLCGLMILYITVIIIQASMEDIELDASKALNLSSQIYYIDSKTGNPTELEKVYGTENRVWVPYTDMPEHLKLAAVAIEDERFFKHGGVDIKRSAGAVLGFFFNRDSGYGGSTITQQLVKNLTDERDRSVTRKIKEMWNAMRLERKYSKEQILEMYLNTIYLSQGCNGVQSAAHMYFNKDVKDLTIAESASIVGITQYPTRYDPFINPDKNKEKQELVLGKMKELGFITPEEYDKAVAEKLKFVKSNMNTGANFQSYFVDQVINDVIKDFAKEKKMSIDEATIALHTGGYKIYATIDPSVQKAVDEVFSNTANFPKKEMQSAIVVMDPYTGEVKGISGGTGKKSGDFVLNRATQSVRQPGSAIKPIAVYAPAIENGLITAGSIYEDKKITIGNWSPKNQYSGFRGPMTVQEAVRISCNTVAVQVLQELGVNKSFNFMKNKLGVTSLVEKREQNGKVYTDLTLPSLALGGLTDGISPMEMTAAYAAIANNGLYIQPHTYTKVVDRNGKTALEMKPETHVAMSEKTAKQMTSILYSVTQSGGTASTAQISRMTVAGKTGTTDEDKDRWFVGYTPYYVSAVWCGYDDAKPIGSLSTNPALAAWKKVYTKIHQGLPSKSFDGINTSYDVSVCSVSGKLYNEDVCKDEAGNPTKKTMRVTAGTAPKAYCTAEDHKKTEATPEPSEAPVTEEPGDIDSNKNSKPNETKPAATTPPPVNTGKPTSTAKPTQSQKPAA